MRFPRFGSRSLPRATAAAAAIAGWGLASAAELPVPEWIWASRSPQPNEEIFLRREIEIPQGVTKAQLTVTADNAFELFLDGNPIERGADWSNPKSRDLTAALTPGKHLFAAHARNEDGSAGFALVLDLTLPAEKTLRIVSDANWTASKTGPRGWTRPDFDDGAWEPAIALGAMGSRPWGDLFGVAPPTGPRDVTAEFAVAEGFILEKLYDVPGPQGSWVAMAALPDGDFVVSDQNGGLFQVTVPAIGEREKPVEVRPLEVGVRTVQGLLWAHGALYAVANSENPGVYRITDRDGDGRLDQAEKLKALSGSGEHGPHGLALSPDEKWIYLVAGNHTDPPATDASAVPPVWQEDQLLPRRPDARGHARDRMAPGGWIARFTPDGSRWELVSVGFRNAYDLAFNDRGDLFSYDSDMEWDLGTPWYRPTRICHVTSGSEFGWRHGTGKWPAYDEDSVPGVLDIGPGSPTGLLAGRELRFPVRYRRAIFALDWTYATIYAIHLTPSGASYTAEKEEFLTGSGLPLADAVAGSDGAMYFVVGGRRTQSALFRVVYEGEESVEPAETIEKSAAAEELAALRRELEALHLHPDPAALDTVWARLSHDDRAIRFAARTALEHLPVETWKRKLAAERDAWTAIQAGIALARVGGAEDQAIALAALDRIDPATLEPHLLINLARAYGLVFARHRGPDDEQRQGLIARFDPLFPAIDDDVNRELCRLLVYLRSPNVVAKTLALMASAPPAEAPDWAELASRNAGFGADVKRMLENMPPTQSLFYAYCLRAMPGPWTEDQRRQFFAWFAEAAEKRGGASYEGFLNDLRERTLEIATDEEREMIAGWNLVPQGNHLENLPQPKGPGRSWTVDEVVAAVEKGLSGRDLKNGREMYLGSLCAACHRLGGDGGAAGPDLSTVAARFTPRDLAEAIVLPNKEISDQFQFSVITRTDGSTLVGKVVDERDDAYIVATNAFDFTQTTEIPRETIRSMEPSPVSPMPPGLINRLNEDELRNLFAYLLRIE